MVCPPSPGICPNISSSKCAANSADATCRVLLHYSQTGSPSQITLLSSGNTPVIQSWQETLNATNEDVLFGYGEFEGNGLVLIYLTEKVGYACINTLPNEDDTDAYSL